MLFFHHAKKSGAVLAETTLVFFWQRRATQLGEQLCESRVAVGCERALCVIPSVLTDVRAISPPLTVSVRVRARCAEREDEAEAHAGHRPAFGRDVGARLRRPTRPGPAQRETLRSFRARAFPATAAAPDSPHIRGPQKLSSWLIKIPKSLGRGLVQTRHHGRACPQWQSADLEFRFEF